MEILIAISFVFAFVLLGTLISLGNERQRRAIDGLREQAEAWAEQDIRIKREKLARQISITEPLAWLGTTASTALGHSVEVVSTSFWQKDGLTALSAICQDGTRLVLTPVPHKRFLKAVKEKNKGALAGMSGTLLGDHPEKVSFQELSVVTSGMFFDIEVSQVWKSLCGESLAIQHLTLYEVPLPVKRK